MSSYDIIIFALLIYFSLYLFVMGWAGIVSQVSLIHRCPYTFHRPTIYLLILGLLFLDPIIERFGEIPALVIFCLLALDFVYETIHPFISSFVEVTSTSEEVLEADLIDAFEKLDIEYKGKYPKYRFPKHRSKLKVKFWPKLSKGEIFIYPRAKMDLLLKIADVVEEDFESAEGTYDIRGYVANIFAAFVIFLFAFWQFLTKVCQVC